MPGVPLLKRVTSSGGGALEFEVDDVATFDAWSGTTNALGLDYEFTAGTAGTPVTTLPSGWLWLDQGTSTYSERLGIGYLYRSNPGGDHIGSGIVRPLTGVGSTWQAHAKMDWGPYPNNWKWAGMHLYDSGSTRHVIMGMRRGGSNYDIGWTRLNAGGSFNSEGRAAIDGGFRPYFLKLIKRSSSDYGIQMSANGVHYQEFYNHDVGAWMTPTHVGINNGIVNGNDSHLGVRWFRCR